jgi:PPM family protein phosphatase
MSFHFKVGVVTDVGKRRTNNEDCFAVDQDVGLFMVADGVGGHKAGSVASTMAVEIIKNSIQDHKEPLLGEYNEEFSQHTNRMLHGIRLANSAVYEAGQRHAEHHSMATTLASVYINGDVMALAHVGDSRIYRLRGACLQRLTVDHSLAEEQRLYGLVTEVAESAYKNAITRALGAEERILIDADEGVVLDGDKILLCTDGLTKMVDEEDVVRIILGAEDDPQEACKALVDTANDQGGTDNITVILVQCEKSPRQVGLCTKVILSILEGWRKIYSGIADCFRSEKGATSLNTEDAKSKMACIGEK